MPIVSKSFVYKRQQRNGSWNVMEQHEDSRGRFHTRPYNIATEDEADALLASRDITNELRDIEEAEMSDHIISGGTPDSYSAADLTTTQKRRRAIRRFMENDMSDRRFICAMAGYVGGFTSVQIASATNISTAKATIVLNRAIRLRDTICPALILDDGDVQ